MLLFEGSGFLIFIFFVKRDQFYFEAYTSSVAAVGIKACLSNAMSPGNFISNWWVGRYSNASGIDSKLDGPVERRGMK